MKQGIFVDSPSEQNLTFFLAFSVNTPEWQQCFVLHLVEINIQFHESSDYWIQIGHFL